MIVTGVERVAVNHPPAPLQKPGMVAVARSAPVGRSPDALRIETVRFGIVTDEQLRLKRLRSILVTGPVEDAVNVWANQVVLESPAP